MLFVGFIFYLEMYFQRLRLHIGEWKGDTTKWKEFEGSGSGLLLRQYPDIRLEGQAEIWNRELPNIKQEC
jgi:hypothetical protein